MTSYKIRFAISLIGLFAALATYPCEEAKDTSRLAIAGGSLTEIVYLFELEHRIVAVDTTSLYPDSAQDFPSIGYVRALSTEGILSTAPTLLLIEDDAGPPHVLQQLEDLELDIRTVPEVQTTAGIIEKVECVATILGVSDEEQQLVRASLENEIARLDGTQNALQEVEAAVIFGINDGIPTVGGLKTAGNSVLTMIGVKNVFSTLSGWKPVSLESMVKANPQVLLIPQRALNDASEQKVIIQSNSIRMTSAGKDERYVVADTMALLGFGPRTLKTAADVAEKIIELMNKAKDSS